MVNHGFSTAGLFLLAGFLVARRGSKRIPDYGGWQRVTPVLAGSFLVVGLSSLALPGLSSFVSEFLVLQGTFMRYEAAAVIATLGIVLAALYILLMYQRVMTGPKPSFAEGESPHDLSWRERGRRRADHRLVPRPRLLPEARPRPPQPRRGAHAAVRRRHRSHADQRLREHEVNPAEFQAVDVDYAAIAPMLIVALGALVGVVVEAFAPRRRRHAVQVWLTTLTLVGAFVALVVWSRESMTVTLGGSVVVDGVSVFLMGALLLLSTMSVLVMAERFGGVGADAFTPMGASTPGSTQEDVATRAGYATSEVFPLALFSVLGMMVFLTANDLITMFVGLEVLSLPLYVMTGLARRRRLLSQEAALKYFLLGAFSSAFFLFGSALLYGYAASSDLRAIARAITTTSGDLDGLLVPGVVLVLVGLLFKVGAVPFHSWTPDAYQGAPTPVTGFMAACTKLAAFGVILRFMFVGVGADRWDWQGAVYVVAVLTMVVGAVLSVTQTDVKRLLAYSSIAHAGFILVGVLAFSQAADQRRDVLPRRVRVRDRRRLRARRHGPPGRVRGVAPLAVGGARAQPPRRRRVVLAPPARLRRHPTHLGLHREVRRLLAGGRGGLGGCGARRHRGARVGGHRLRLRSPHRPHVLHRRDR